uniref:UPF0481 protein At3g47200-like n=1 Tax=Cicer arietinum TaxID=3827 RepID=A0A1S2YWN7_CICAR|nr:UPF0481 protein At3g47200-like [Cicer arietinum]
MEENIMKERLAQLKEAQQRFHQNNQISIPKIQRVPQLLRQNKRFYKYCTPKIISFGPIHHNSESLKEGHRYKLLWTSPFVATYARKIDQDDNQACQLLLKKIEDDINKLKNMFHEDVAEGYNDNDLSWMLFVDGCALLHFMENVDDQRPQELNLKLDQLMNIWRDVMLLENQLPMKLLEILCEDWRTDLEFLFQNYLGKGKSKHDGMYLIPLKNYKYIHILDYSRSIFLSSFLNTLDYEENNQIETQSKEMSTTKWE